jgi:hypothetical protein
MRAYSIDLRARVLMDGTRVWERTLLRVRFVFRQRDG